MKYRYILKRINAFLIDYLVVSFLATMSMSLFFPYIVFDIEKFDELALMLSTGVSIDKMLPIIEDLVIYYSRFYFVILGVGTMYYVVITKLLKNRTIGCVATKQLIIKTDKTPVTKSDLTLKMLLTNGMLLSLIVSIVLVVVNDALTGMLIAGFASFIYGMFLILNFINLLIKGTTFVDKITKTRPVIVLRIPKE